MREEPRTRKYFDSMSSESVVASLSEMAFC
jgi:hypothetical protein